MKIYVHWLLRIQLAAIFLYHGFTKFPTAAMMAQGMGMPIAMVYLLGTMESLGGVLILLGGLKINFSEIANKIACLIFIVVMIGAIYLVHWPQWSFMATAQKPAGGMEFQILIIAVSLYLFIKGQEA